MLQIHLRHLFMFIAIMAGAVYLSYKSFHHYLYFNLETDQYCYSMFVGGFFEPADSGEKGLWRAPCNLIYREGQNESVDCLSQRSAHLQKENHIVLMGDSRIRQIRDGLIYHLSGVEHDFYVNPAIPYDQQLYKKHESTVTTIPNANLRIEFFWSVELDEHGGSFGEALRALEKNSSKPDLIIVGAGVWIMKHCTYNNISQVDCVKKFKSNFAEPMEILNRFANNTAVIWTPQNLVDEPRLVHLEPSHRELTNKNMMFYNNAMRKSFMDDPLNKIIYWDTYLQTDLQIDDTPDGLHVGPITRNVDIQILLNLLCNPFISKNSLTTDPGTCCCCKN